VAAVLRPDYLDTDLTIIQIVMISIKIIRALNSRHLKLMVRFTSTTSVKMTTTITSSLVNYSDCNPMKISSIYSRILQLKSVRHPSAFNTVTSSTVIRQTRHTAAV